MDSNKSIPQSLVYQSIYSVPRARGDRTRSVFVQSHYVAFLFCLLLSLFSPISKTTCYDSPTFCRSVSLLIVSLHTRGAFRVATFRCYLLTFPRSRDGAYRVYNAGDDYLGAFQAFCDCVASVNLSLRRGVIYAYSTICAGGYGIASYVFLRGLRRVVSLVYG